ncbi:hypothetical protein ACLB2K_068292 [Fragaria x ananassa]
MNGNGQMEVHYIDTGFPYPATESFMDFFDGLTHVPLNYGHPMPVHDQACSLFFIYSMEAAYWSMNMNSYKFGLTGPESTSYCSPYEVNTHFPRMDMSRRAWEYPLMTNSEEPATTATQPEENVVEESDATTEESIPNDQNTTTSQVEWEENIDPDNMTYEELLDLGEAVGTQSRGLSDELISMLPTTKYKCGSFFSRKKSGERQGTKEELDKSNCPAIIFTIVNASANGLASTRYAQSATLRYSLRNQGIKASFS